MGLTAWSGVDALSAKGNLGAQRTQAEVDDARSRIRRTDYFLAGAVLAGAATAIVGGVFVDWKKDHGLGALEIGPHGLVVGARGRF